MYLTDEAFVAEQVEKHDKRVYAGRMPAANKAAFRMWFGRWTKTQNREHNADYIWGEEDPFSKYLQ